MNEDPEQYLFWLTNPGTELRPVKNGKLSDCYIAERNILHPQRIFSLDQHESRVLGVIKKTHIQQPAKIQCEQEDSWSSLVEGFQI